MNPYHIRYVQYDEANDCVFIEIPDDLIIEMDWWFDDKLELVVQDGKLIISNISKKNRDRESNNE